MTLGVETFHWREVPDFSSFLSILAWQSFLLSFLNLISIVIVFCLCYFVSFFFLFWSQMSHCSPGFA